MVLMVRCSLVVVVVILVHLLEWLKKGMWWSVCVSAHMLVLIWLGYVWMSVSVCALEWWRYDDAQTSDENIEGEID
jgi:hypothetical protein